MRFCVCVCVCVCAETPRRQTAALGVRANCCHRKLGQISDQLFLIKHTFVCDNLRQAYSRYQRANQWHCQASITPNTSVRYT